MGSSRGVFCVAIAVCVLYSAHDSAKESEPAGYTVHNRIGVGHEAPEFLSRPVFRVEYGHSVEILDTDGYWHRVQPQGDYSAGWLHRSDLSLPEIRLQPVDKKTRKRVKEGEIDLLGRAFRPLVAQTYRDKSPRDEKGYVWLDAHADDAVYRPSFEELYRFLEEGELQ